MKSIAASIVLFLAAAGAQAQVFDFSTFTLRLPQVTVGTAVYDATLRYDADGRFTVTRLVPTTASIVGTWYAERTPASGAKLRMAFTFLADGTYMMADNGNTTSSDPTGQPGIEVGAYTYDASSGVLSTSCPSINSDGEWGLSHGRQNGGSGCTGTRANVNIQGNTMTLSVQEGTGTSSLTLTRVTP